MPYFVYGEVQFDRANKRDAVVRRLDTRAARAGFVPEVWRGLVDAYGSWPAGKEAVTKDGRPTLRFCYRATEAAMAEEQFSEVASTWDVFSESDSWWAFAETT